MLRLCSWFALYEAARFSIECKSAVILMPWKVNLDAFSTSAKESKDSNDGK